MRKANAGDIKSPITAAVNPFSYKFVPPACLLAPELRRADIAALIV